MSTSRTHDVPVVLKAAQQRFEHWRRTHRARSRIPDSLWAAAVRAARTCGVHRTAQALRLSYYSLKDRLEEQSTAAANPAGRCAGAGFLELAPLAPQGVDVVSSGDCECTFELEELDGAKKRVSLKGVPIADLAALCRRFWE
jgi:hypothetical protein